jgi:hypothetical protein
VCEASKNVSDLAQAPKSKGTPQSTRIGWAEPVRVSSFPFITQSKKWCTSSVDGTGWPRRVR